MKAVIGLLFLAVIVASCSSGPNQIELTQTALVDQQQQLELAQTALASELIPETPASPTLSIPTETPTPIPEFSPEEQRALTPVTANDDWTPVERQINGVTMVLVPAGCFTMSESQNAHEQCIDDPFWIDKYEVTNSQYAHFVDDGGYDNPDYWTETGWNWRENSNATQAGLLGDARFNNSRQPVVGVNWYEAFAYAQWRGCHLPTEAQWEFAARGPDSLLYPWGNSLVTNNLIYRPNSEVRPATVGGRAAGASWVGAVDMAGNVWEWTSSIFTIYPYNADDGRENLEGTSRRVYRGGSWDNTEFSARTHYRNVHNPNVRANNIGIRVICPAPALD